MRLPDIGCFARDRRARIIERPDALRRLHRRNRSENRPISPLNAGGVLFAADLLAYVTAFLIVRITVAQPPEAVPGVPERLIELTANWHSWGLLAIGAGLLMTWHMRGHYSERLPQLVESWHVIAGTFVAVVSACALKLAVDGTPFNLWLLLMWPLAVPLQMITRRLAKSMLSAVGSWKLRTLLIGDVDNLHTLSQALESESTLGYQIVRRAPLPPATATSVEDYWASSLELAGADFVVVAIGSRHNDGEQQVIDSLTHARIPFAVAPQLSGFPVRGVSSHYFFSHDVVLIVSRNNLARPISRAVKSMFDFAVASIAVVLLAPLLLVIGSFVKTDGGPIFFAHERLGAGGRRFRCLKFRTMVINSQEVLAELLERDPNAAAEWAATQKLRNDPRITPIGRFLRNTSLDELPQLFNVLAGDMSLVGPRPIVEAEIVRYERDISFYYAARPGVTGLWQVSGRSDTSYAQRVRLDVWYVKNWSLWHDLAILLKTVPALLHRRGAV